MDVIALTYGAGIINFKDDDIRILISTSVRNHSDETSGSVLISTLLL